MTPREIQLILDKPWDEASTVDVEKLLRELLVNKDEAKRDEIVIWVRYVVLNLIKETGRLHDQLRGLRPAD